MSWASTLARGKDIHSKLVFNRNLIVYVVVLGIYVPPTAMVIRRRDLGLKSHLKDRKSPGSNPRLLDYKAIHHEGFYVVNEVHTCII